MILNLFPKLKGNAFIRFLRDFYGCGAYPVLIVALMTCSTLFAWELTVYYLMISLIAVGLLVTDDALCALPVACCGYMTIAPANSPIHHAGTTVFSDPSFVIQLAFLLFVGVVLLFARLLMRIAEGGKIAPPRLFGGFLVLGIAYMLGGAGTAHFSFRSSLFGFVQFVSLALLYVYFSLTVDWDRVKKSYLPFLFTAIGVGICIEIADMYTIEGVFSADGSIDRNYLYMGWGVYNNVACIMAMCIPAPCYFAVRRKHGWPFTLLAAVFYFATCFTQSRGGILFGSVVALVCVFYILIASGRARRAHLAVLIVLALLALAAAVSMSGKFAAIFASLIKIGFNPNYRDTIYRDCWEAFLSSPFFGVGFYDTPGVTFDQFANFMPPRAHDTYFQLLASGGLLSVCAYAVHRIQTLNLLFRRPSHEKAFVGFVILALMLTSVVDCNFFNIGPGILYGILLAFAEGTDSVPRVRTMLRPLGERRRRGSAPAFRA